MHPKKNSKLSEANADPEAELRRLIQEQQRDADATSVARGTVARGADPVVTRDGAIRSQAYALRDLVAPPPDELLTRPPDDDDDDEPADQAPPAGTTGDRPSARGPRSSGPTDPSSGPARR